MPEEKNSTVSKETVDVLEKKTSEVVTQETLSIDISNHPDPVKKGSTTAKEVGEMEHAKVVGLELISTEDGDKEKSNIVSPCPNLEKSIVLRVENDMCQSNLTDVSSDITKDANKEVCPVAALVVSANLKDGKDVEVNTSTDYNVIEYIVSQTQTGDAEMADANKDRKEAEENLSSVHKSVESNVDNNDQDDVEMADNIKDKNHPEKSLSSVHNSDESKVDENDQKDAEMADANKDGNVPGENLSSLHKSDESKVDDNDEDSSETEGSSLQLITGELDRTKIGDGRNDENTGNQSIDTEEDCSELNMPAVSPAKLSQKRDDGEDEKSNEEEDNREVQIKEGEEKSDDIVWAPIESEIEGDLYKTKICPSITRSIFLCHLYQTAGKKLKKFTKNGNHNWLQYSMIQITKYLGQHY